MDTKLDNKLAVRPEANALEEYGKYEQVQELARRVKIMMPGGARLNDEEAIAVAQVAIMHRLDPFTGEVWGLKSGNAWYGVMIGIKGLRKKAHEKIEETKDCYWIDFYPEDPAMVLPEENCKNAKCWRAELRDTLTLRAYTQAMQKFTSEMKIPYEIAKEICGASPVTVGYGVAFPNEEGKFHCQDRARKRAEAAAIRQRFDLEFQYGENEDMLDEDQQDQEIINGKFRDVPISEKNSDQLVSELGFDMPQSDTAQGEAYPRASSAVASAVPHFRPYPPDVVKSGLEQKLQGKPRFQPNQAQLNLLRHGLELLFVGDVNTEDKRRTVLKYLTGYTSTKEVDGQWFKVLVEEWLKMNKSEDGSGEYTIDNLAAQEAQAIVDAALIDEGQLGLPV